MNGCGVTKAKAANANASEARICLVVKVRLTISLMLTWLILGAGPSGGDHRLANGFANSFVVQVHVVATVAAARIEFSRG